MVKTDLVATKQPVSLSIEGSAVIQERDVAHEAAPADPKAKPKFTKRQVASRLRQLKALFQEWLITDDFYNRKVAECETVL